MRAAIVRPCTNIYSITKAAVCSITKAMVSVCGCQEYAGHSKQYMPVSETSRYSAGKGYGEVFEQLFRFPWFG